MGQPIFSLWLKLKYMLMLGVLYVEFVIEALGSGCYVPIRHY